MKNKMKKLKAVLAFTLVVFMGVAIVGTALTADAAKKKGGNGTYAEGDDIAFGQLDGGVMHWTILTYDDTTKTALVISRRALNSRAITTYRQNVNNIIVSSKKTGNYVRWSDNYWRAFCNKLMYKNCFNSEERAKIKKTTHDTKSEQTSLMNFYHDTTLDGDYLDRKVKNSLLMDIYDTQTTSTDYIFFLSSDEYTEYKDTIKYESNCIWPLRTNAYDETTACLFVNDSKKLIYKGYHYGGDGIRPAMYVQLEEPDATQEETTSTTSSAKTSTTASDKTTSDKTTTTTNKTNTANTAQTTAKNTTKKASFANNGTNIGNVTLPDDSLLSMRRGGTAQVAIDMEYLNSTDKEYTVTYKSSDANVFTVDANGKITANSIGTGTLTVRMKKSNGKVYTMSCRVDVT